MPRKRYFQDRGQPHKGLDDPAKYGLTFDEVVELINTGQWSAFNQRWKRKEKREKQLAELHYICPKCNKVELDTSKWTGLRCTVCYKKEQVELGAKSIRYSKNFKCLGCTRAVDGPDKLCGQCSQLLTKMRELENDT